MIHKKNQNTSKVIYIWYCSPMLVVEICQNSSKVDSAGSLISNLFSKLDCSSQQINKNLTTF